VFKKIINKFKSKQQTPYGKNCQYFIDHSYEVEQMLQSLGVRDKDGRHICGFTLQTEVNELGDEVFKKYGTRNFCDECGMPQTDSRRPIYRKCTDRNRYKKCKDFLPKTRLQKLTNALKGSIIKLKVKLSKWSINRKTILIYLMLFTIIYSIYHDLYLLMSIKQITIYLIVCVPAFLYALSKEG
jgi:hypothetical protein